MLPLSLNRWPVLAPSDRRLATGTVPGTKVRLTLRREVLPLFLALGADYDQDIEPLSLGRADDGGYSYRQARSGDGWSNHASGSAVDFNWTGHGARNLANRKWWNLRRNKSAVDIIKARYKVLAWGGDWSDKYYDPMHWEIRPGVSIAMVEAVIARLRIDPQGIRHG